MQKSFLVALVEYGNVSSFFKLWQFDSGTFLFLSLFIVIVSIPRLLLLVQTLLRARCLFYLGHGFLTFIRRTKSNFRLIVSNIGPLLDLLRPAR